MGQIAVTVVGRDRPGIIAGITSALSELGGNLEDSSMTILRGHFAMTLVVDVDETPSAVSAALQAVCGELGVGCSVAEIDADLGQQPTGNHYLLTLHGGDRPGIVAAVTGLLAERGGNVTDMTTRLSAGLYVLACEVDLPPNVDIDALQRDLAGLADRLGVRAALRPVETDVL